MNTLSILCALFAFTLCFNSTFAQDLNNSSNQIKNEKNLEGKSTPNSDKIEKSEDTNPDQKKTNPTDKKIKIKTKKTLFETSSPTTNASDFNISFQNAIEDEYEIEEIAPTWLDGKRYKFKIPLKTISDTTRVFKTDGEKNIELNTDQKNNTKLLSSFDYIFLIKDRLQCDNLKTLDKKKIETTYTLCVEVVDKDLTKLGVNTESFFYRRTKGWFVQGGLGYVFQDIPGVYASDLNSYSLQGVARVGFGGWWKKYTVEGAFRTKAFEINKKKYSPRWMSGHIGYWFELPRFWLITPHITLLLGLEKYDNLSQELNIQYLQNSMGPTFGFRSRFSFGSRAEIGGEFLTAQGGITKYFVQGDIRYWLNNNWALGAGYWYDVASATIDEQVFREISVALEGYLRYTF